MPYAPQTVRDIQGYTFVLTNIYPLRNYNTVEPIPDYKFVVDESRLFDSYDGADMSQEKIIFPTQAFYAGGDAASVTPPPPKPQVEWPSIPGSGLPSEHTQMRIASMPVQLPTRTSAGFLDYNSGFGWSVSLETQYWHSYAYQSNLRSAPADTWSDYVESAEELDISFHYSNVDQPREWSRTMHLSGYTTPMVYCRVIHATMGDGMEEALETAESIHGTSGEDTYEILGFGSTVDSSGGTFSTGQLDLVHSQFLYQFEVRPFSLMESFCRESPSGDAVWVYSTEKDTFEETLIRRPHEWPLPGEYEYVWDHYLVTYDDEFAPGLGILTRTVFRSSALGEWDRDCMVPKKEYLRKLFFDLDKVTEKRDLHVTAMTSYFSALLGSTFKVPKEFRAKRQLSPNRMQTMITSLGPGTEYIATSSPSMTAGAGSGGTTGGY